MIESIFKYISNNYQFVSGVIITAAISFLIYFLQKQRTRLRYRVRDTKIVGRPSSAFEGELVIQFAGEIIPRIVGSRVVIWNAGNTIVNGGDVAPANPLRIAFKSDYIDDDEIKREVGHTKFLQVNLEKVSRTDSNVSFLISDDKKSATISFDFLSPNEGFVLRAIHTSVPNDVELAGALKSSHKHIERVGPAKKLVGHDKKIWLALNRQVRKTPFGIIFLIVGIVFSVAASFPEVLVGLIPTPPISTLPERVSAGLVGVTYILLGARVLWQSNRQPPKTLTN